MAPGRSLKVTLDDGHLQGEQTGSAKQPLVPVPGTTSGVGRGDGAVTRTFTVGANGRATALVMRESGSERALPKMKRVATTNDAASRRSPRAVRLRVVVRAPILAPRHLPPRTRA